MILALNGLTSLEEFGRVYVMDKSWKNFSVDFSQIAFTGEITSAFT